MYVDVYRAVAHRGEVYFAYCMDSLYVIWGVQFYGRDGHGRRVFEKQRVSFSVCVSEQAENENESKQQCAAMSSTATPSLW